MSDFLSIPEKNQISVHMYTEKESLEIWESYEARGKQVVVPSIEDVIWQDKYAIIIAPDPDDTAELPQHLIDVGLKYFRAEISGENKGGINAWTMVDGTARGR